MRHSIKFLPAVVAIVAASPSAFAQAWVAEENTLTASFAYQFVTSSKLLGDNGVVYDPVDDVHHVFMLAFEYGTPLPGLQAEISLPFYLMYWEDQPHFTESANPHGPWDDNGSHFTPTDLKLGLRYGIFDGDPLAIAVAAGISFPIADYPVRGFAAPGRHLLVGTFGIALGKTFDPWLPRLYVTASYDLNLSPAFDETPETAAYSQTRSDFSAQIGYVIIDDLAVNIGFDLRSYHGGLNFTQFVRDPVTNELPDFGNLTIDEILAHDAILAETAMFLGGGVGYQLLENLNVNAMVRFFLGGQNTRNATLLGLGISYQIF